MRKLRSVPLNDLDDLKLSSHELLKYAYDLSLIHKVYIKKVKYGHLSLNDVRRNIENAYLAAKQNKYRGRDIPAISEWFYDNRFLFIEQIKQIELNKSTYRLPHIKNGRFAHYPRSLVLAVELVTHSSYHITESSIQDFLEAYQKETGLDSGELWIFIDMIKIALLYAVSKMSRKSVEYIRMRAKAEKFSAQVKGDVPAGDSMLTEYKNVLFNPVFIEHAMALLRENPQAANMTERINRRLAVRDLSVDKLIKKAHAYEAKNIMHISNAISSLRTLSKINFEAIFENVSVVHNQLCEDDDYLRMDFESREYYRKCIADIAKSIKASEAAVSKTAVRLANMRGEHVGVYIAGPKKHELMKEYGKLPFKEKANTFFKRHMLLLYVGGAIVSTVISAAILCISLFFMYPLIYGILGFFISLIPIYAVAVAVSNRIFMLLNKPAFIPKMALADGITEDCATMVAVTTLLTSVQDGADMLEKMQVYYAANQQNNIYFALLSDFRENKNEITPEDVEIIEKTEAAVEKLNKKYGRNIFYYAQRKRSYLRGKKKFAGRERKRGALLDFCALFRGEADAFMHVTKGMPQEIKYVITLDADTELSRDAAVKMVGAMEHPLNRPLVDSATNTVTSGYGIMQPRIGIDVVSMARTRFSLVFSGKAGLDTYACAVSDIYQDGFGTGIYTGKGIFNLPVYERVLKNTFPDNAVLSHDLLEGSYLRCALLSDVVLMDGYPAKYISWAERQHRWTRGDWQLMPWLKKKVRTKDGRVKNPLSKLAKYQIVDNMRRSLVMPFSFIVILLSQTAFYRSAFFWFISGILPLFIDSLLDFGTRIWTLIKNARKGATFKDAWYETKTMFEQAAYKFTFLPYETYMMLDAVIRTIVRVAVTKKNMLEWVTAAEGEKKKLKGAVAYWRKMRAAPILAVILYALSILTTHSFSIIAFLVSGLWFFAPAIAYTISKERKVKRYPLDIKQRIYLEDVALKTWRFFERFTFEEEYYWTPDNYQQSPNKGIAKRTSPTNVAFSLAAGIAAYYMGFITLDSTVKRLDRCVQGIECAPKWEGHLYNWYDITNLEPLEPRYISSVDSGNLASYLVLAFEALNDMPNTPIAANIQQGMAAVSRESGREMSFSIGGDVFNAVAALDLVEEKGDTLDEMTRSVRDYIDRIARWASVLVAFPAQQVHLYTDQTKALRDKLRQISIEEYIREFHSLLELLSGVMEKADRAGDGAVLEWVKAMETALGESYVVSRRLSARIDKLKRRLMTLFNNMDFSKLYDEGKGLFSIGLDTRQNKLSDTHYDLLASEARQTGFIAIAKGDVPGKHWFRLSRPLTIAGESRVLLSWGGTMFEYLLPLITMKSYDHTLLSETYKSVVDMQYDYAEQRRIPWGISESGYYAFDLQMNYQYKAFGVPGLGMRSGLIRETVVSPYSVCLALLVNPKLALANMARLEKMGALGRFGFYEAIDYTQSRMHRGKKKRIVKSYMAHHQGMIIASIFNCLYEGKMQTLFHSNTCVKATEMLLKEKVPPRNILLNLGEKQPEEQPFADEIHAARSFKNYMTYPEAHFLSNGSYTTMLTQYGTGCSMYQGIMINRWYHDSLRRAPGIHVYIKDTATGAVWSAALLPTCVMSKEQRTVFEPHKVTFYREVGPIETTLEICVSPESDMEIRSLNIKNNSDEDAALAVYCAYTPALCSERDFKAHPAFAELFVQTLTDHEKGTIYARRRGRDVWNGVKVCGSQDVELMTDRAGIFGRQNTFGVPACMSDQRSERDVAQAVGIKCGIAVPAKEAGSVAFAIAAAHSMQGVADSLAGVTGEDDVRRVFQLAWTHSQVEMRYLKLKDTEASLFQKIASRTVIKIPPVFTAQGDPGGIDTLWKMGISGDLPIICMFAHDIANIDMVRTVAKAHEFMSHRRVGADLVIIYDGGAEYLCPLRDRIKEFEMAASGSESNKIAAFSRDHLTETDIATLLHAACLVLEDTGSLQEQLKVERIIRPLNVFERPGEKYNVRMPKRLRAFDNGRGGFINYGTEYCIDVVDTVPLPWSNILVNPSFGSLVSAGGGGYTWAENAQMTRLTPFRNDSLTDVAGEGLLIRNDRTGEVFSAAPDNYAAGQYRIVHGFGYTIFERYGSIGTQATYFVDRALPVKAGILNITNNTDITDTFSVYYFAEPAIGKTACQGVTAVFCGRTLAASTKFSDPNRAMYIAMPGQEIRYTASAYEFFGSPGNNILPEALKTKELSNSAGNGASLLALQTRVRLAPGQSKSLAVLMGYGDTHQTNETMSVLTGFEDVNQRLEQTKAYWQNLVGSIKVSTSNKSFDTLVNGWLTYQTYAARLWGRTGYYQSGGAYGFRDQLQDVLSLVYTNPGMARDHILKCAERQFAEGDVLHWWHEPTRGVRTRISDDKLFLPYVACEYERMTGDMSVFDENVRYLEGPHIPDGKEDVYQEFSVGDACENVFMHCVRAIDSALVFGEHGLPLMGTGDWNDGMDKVGKEGRGESVWLAFFLVEVLRMFTDLCRIRGEHVTAQRFENQRQALRVNIERNAWDGEWYMRAFFDDGTPIGSSASPECKIDLVSQAWAVISGAVRARHAYAAADEHLVMREEGIIRLLSPPFDRWEKNPGYIKDYLPGLRENGGQYTHAAAWFVIAAAKMRQKDDAIALFSMLNPINHTRTAAGVAKYKGEPYVMAADVYYTDAHKGRAGWTWYTGTAGWMFQAAVMHILGMRIERGMLSVNPCVPDDFGRYTIEYDKDGTVYIINVDIKPGYRGCAWLTTADGNRTKSIALDKQGGVHLINACW